MRHTKTRKVYLVAELKTDGKNCFVSRDWVSLSNKKGPFVLCFTFPIFPAEYVPDMGITRFSEEAWNSLKIVKVAEELEGTK